VHVQIVIIWFVTLCGFGGGHRRCAELDAFLFDVNFAMYILWELFEKV
jgi:hypothetical protein